MIMTLKDSIIKTPARKLLLPAFLLCAVLGCSACADTSDMTPEQNPAQDSAGQSDPVQAEADSEAGSETEAAPPEQDIDTAAETDTIVSVMDPRIQIETHEEKSDRTTDDGTVYLEHSCKYPIVSIEGNEAAAEKINDSILSIADLFNKDTSAEEVALMNFESVMDDDSDYPFYPYQNSMYFEAPRADSNVISFVMSYYTYTGGAHGYLKMTCINYNTKTGEQISFADLSDDPAAFLEDTLAYNKKLAATEDYKDLLYTPDIATDGTLESVLYADDAWCLTAEGLTFISNPYDLGPYAAGTIKFLIPYADLTDLGFKQAYFYPGRLVRQLHTDKTAYHDLNGDGKEESILFYLGTDENADNDYATVPHLAINGTDFAQSSVMKDLTDQFTWAELELFDLNVEDAYIDLAFITSIVEDHDAVLHTFFYRYMPDGSLVYLGKTRGDVNNLATTIDLVR